MKKKLIVLVGLPTSGKSWAGEYINTKFGIPFYSRIDELHSGGKRLPWNQTNGFDEERLDKQLLFDKTLTSLRPEITCIIVEGWHIENYAYALIRAPHLKHQYKEIISEMLLEFEVHIFYFARTPDEVIDWWVDLSNEEVIIARNWFRDWLMNIAQITSDYKIPIDTLASDIPAEDPVFIQRIEYLMNELQCGS